MMKYIAILTVIIPLCACTKIRVEEDIPDLKGMAPLSIRTDLPVIDIKADVEMFEDMYLHYGRKILIPANVSYYDEEREEKLKGEASYIEVKGTSSAKYVMKSIGITFRHAIDNEEKQIIRPPDLLEGDRLKFLYTLRLRNSGNDFGKTMLKDLAYTQLAISAGLNMELMYGKPVHTFVNEKYYGMLNLRTESNRLGIAGLLERDTSEITLMEVDVDNGNLEYEEGNAEYAQEVENAIERKDGAILRQWIDIDNFIDYVIYQDYIGNIDWPGNNVRAYSLGGAPFRFILYDLDYAAFRTKDALLPELEYRDDDVSKIFQILFKEDEKMMKKLENRQQQLYQKLTPEKFNDIVDQLAIRIEGEIPYMVARYKQPSSSFQWRLELDALKREFERRDHYIRRKYNLL